ncbi:hypothetical protein AYR46_13905 [Sphingobium yanoikuyae]|uniref:Uncharacterized protein n=1 Tax=Sphingobium yanoikuyae TaxID=13690 RepID=A0A3G2UUH7_SPHYA|nr:hypothetical protein EBF16_18400 [Sphingobium yanoikuyae]KZC79192.1 hypothetical protein AYR46_13905 [Sphingobium yanoikuyae]
MGQAIVACPDRYIAGRERIFARGYIDAIFIDRIMTGEFVIDRLRTEMGRRYGKRQGRKGNARDKTVHTVLVLKDIKLAWGALIF